MKSRPIPLNDWIVIILFASVFVFFYILPLDQRIYHLGDDFAQYIQHARNISQNRPYGSLPYPFNPQAQFGPPAYPPIYPLLLSPFSNDHSLPVVPYKAENVVLLILSLLILYKIFQYLGNDHIARDVLFAFTFLPWIFDTMGDLGSTTPYVFFSSLALWFLITLPVDRPAWLHALSTGLLIAIATLTRDIGIALWVGGGLFFIQKIRERPQNRAILSIQFLVISLIFISSKIAWEFYENQQGLGPSNWIYFHTSLGLNKLTLLGFLKRLLSNLYYYIQKSYEILFPVSSLIRPIPVLNWLRFPLALIILPILGWQIFKSRREPFFPLTLYSAAYLGVFFIMDYHISKNGVRMIIPITPFLLFYLFKGFKEWSLGPYNPFKPSAYRVIILLWIGLSILGTSRFLSSRESLQNLALSPEGPAYKTMVAHIKQELPKDARIACFKLRYLSLYTDRQTVIPPFLGPPSFVGPPEQIINYLRQWQVTYILLDDQFSHDEMPLRKTLAQFPEYFSFGYTSPPLHLYQFSTKGGQDAGIQRLQ